MTIQIELKPDLEQRLAAEARVRGMALEGYAEQILQDAMAANQNCRPRASQEEFRRFLDALAHKGTKGAPSNVDTFSREMIYGEHD